MNRQIKLTLLAVLLTMPFAGMEAAKKPAVEPLRISVQQRVPSELEKGALVITNRIEAWNPKETAIIICDMWDKHWCRDATDRVAEMAPHMNEVLTIAREKGVKIVHAPSECMDFYKDYPGRKEAQKYNDPKIAALANGGNLPSEEGAVWPVDQSDEGCENADCKPAGVWKRQIETLTVKDEDLITDSGTEAGSYFKKKGIKNVILVGVHTNMCVIGRSFGLRAMKRMGMNIVLMRDMTDLMYNHEMWPYVDHFSGLDLMVEYIETYVCPSIVSSDFTGKKQFKFKGDKRPRVAILTAESEYRANQRLPEFAHDLTLKKNIHCDYALGIPIMGEAKKDADPKVKAEYAAFGMPVDTDGKTEAPTRHNLENLQILEDADLAIFFIRRRALEPEKMQAIKTFVASGKPVIGIRTSSHAFDAKGNVPRSGGGIVAAKENASDMLAQWPEFDAEVWGGNYQGHYGHLQTGTDFSIVPGMENHPLLKGVQPFTTPNWLYRNRPLRSANAVVLMLGSNPGVPDEPVAWINNNRAIYTSLGHWDDWKQESFRNLMFNSVDYLLNLIKN
ncbi:MAG: isochorismatase family protein [Tannerella sp.]|nr:isochorismatase family protein [Tannerella sp.]